MLLSVKVVGGRNPSLCQGCQWLNASLYQSCRRTQYFTLSRLSVNKILYSVKVVSEINTEILSELITLTVWNIEWTDNLDSVKYLVHLQPWQSEVLCPPTTLTERSIESTVNVVSGLNISLCQSCQWNQFFTMSMLSVNKILYSVKVVSDSILLSVEVVGGRNTSLCQGCQWPDNLDRLKFCVRRQLWQREVLSHRQPWRQVYLSKFYFVFQPGMFQITYKTWYI
jgi:hypothetical protein